MNLKDGNKYVSKVDGSPIKLVKSNNDKWFIRFLGKQMAGDSAKFGETAMIALLESGYTPKK